MFICKFGKQKVVAIKQWLNYRGKWSLQCKKSYILVKQKCKTYVCGSRKVTNYCAFLPLQICNDIRHSRYCVQQSRSSNNEYDWIKNSILFILYSTNTAQKSRVIFVADVTRTFHHITGIEWYGVTYVSSKHKSGKKCSAEVAIKTQNRK